MTTIGPTDTVVSLIEDRPPTKFADDETSRADTGPTPDAGPTPFVDRPPVTIPWGPDNLARRWFSDAAPPTPEALTNALGTIDDYLADADREWRLPTTHTIRTLTVTGYSVGAIARLETGVAEPPNALDISRVDLEEIFRIAATEPTPELALNPGLAPGDTDVLPGALCVVAAIVRRYRVPAIRFTETGSQRR